MLKSILVGLLLTIVTVGVHVTGTTWWINRLLYLNKTQNNKKFQDLRILFSTATVLLLLHIFEVIIWAVSYLYIEQIDHIDSLEEASYFSIVTFTSLGYGDLVIDNSWRLLSGIQSMAGLFVFGWSTALLFTIFQKIWFSKIMD